MIPEVIIPEVILSLRCPLSAQDEKASPIPMCTLSIESRP
jgi:hypothetical protein